MLKVLPNDADLGRKKKYYTIDIRPLLQNVRVSITEKHIIEFPVLAHIKNPGPTILPTSFHWCPHKTKPET